MAPTGVEEDIVEWLDDFGCDREPFTPSHKDCQCLKASKAAKLISRLQEELKEARAKTIEECAKLAALSATASEDHGDAEGAFMAREIEMAIRSMDGG